MGSADREYRPACPDRIDGAIARKFERLSQQQPAGQPQQQCGFASGQHFVADNGPALPEFAGCPSGPSAERARAKFRPLSRVGSSVSVWARRLGRINNRPGRSGRPLWFERPAGPCCLLPLPGNTSGAETSSRSIGRRHGFAFVGSVQGGKMPCRSLILVAPIPQPHHSQGSVMCRAFLRNRRYFRLRLAVHALVRAQSFGSLYCSRPMLTLTRSVSEGRNALPRLRFGLVCLGKESLIFGRVQYRWAFLPVEHAVGRPARGPP